MDPYSYIQALHGISRVMGQMDEIITHYGKSKEEDDPNIFDSEIVREELVVDEIEKKGD